MENLEEENIEESRLELFNWLGEWMLTQKRQRTRPTNTGKTLSKKGETADTAKTTTNPIQNGPVNYDDTNDSRGPTPTTNTSKAATSTQEHSKGKSKATITPMT